jgi:hypothetical protein
MRFEKSGPIGAKLVEVIANPEPAASDEWLCTSYERILWFMEGIELTSGGKQNLPLPCGQVWKVE